MQQHDPNVDGGRESPSFLLSLLVIPSGALLGATVVRFLVGDPHAFSGGDDWMRKAGAEGAPYLGALLGLLLGCALVACHWKGRLPTWGVVALVALGNMATLVLFLI
jgi:hypothetical protein